MPTSTSHVDEMTRIARRKGTCAPHSLRKDAQCLTISDTVFRVMLREFYHENPAL